MSEGSFWPVLQNQGLSDLPQLPRWPQSFLYRTKETLNFCSNSRGFQTNTPQHQKLQSFASVRGNIDTPFLWVLKELRYSPIAKWISHLQFQNKGVIHILHDWRELETYNLRSKEVSDFSNAPRKPQIQALYNQSTKELLQSYNGASDLSF